MVIKEKDVKRYSAIALILVLIVVAFIVVKPILLSVIAGLILAYIFYPLFKIAFYVLREKNTAAFAVCILVVLILFLSNNRCGGFRACYSSRNIGATTGRSNHDLN